MENEMTQQVINKIPEEDEVNYYPAPAEEAESSAGALAIFGGVCAFVGVIVYKYVLCPIGSWIKGKIEKAKAKKGKKKPKSEPEDNFEEEEFED